MEPKSFEVKFFWDGENASQCVQAHDEESARQQVEAQYPECIIWSAKEDLRSLFHACSLILLAQNLMPRRFLSEGTVLLDKMAADLAYLVEKNRHLSRNELQDLILKEVSRMNPFRTT